MSGEGTEREDDTESEAGSTEPDAGLEPQMARSRPGWKSDAQPTEPPRRPKEISFRMKPGNQQGELSKSTALGQWQTQWGERSLARWMIVLHYSRRRKKVFPPSLVNGRLSQ